MGQLQLQFDWCQSYDTLLDVWAFLSMSIILRLMSGIYMFTWSSVPLEVNLHCTDWKYNTSFPDSLDEKLHLVL